MKKIPPEDIQKILKVSYDGLGEIEQEIFLDIACFFQGWPKNDVADILNACELNPDFGIPRLVKKCLITVTQGGSLSMHDLIQQMGREVVRQESRQMPGERSRIWSYEDGYKVLIGNTVYVLFLQIFLFFFFYQVEIMDFSF